MQPTTVQRTLEQPTSTKKESVSAKIMPIGKKDWRGSEEKK
jgi:hypothetical protein